MADTWEERMAVRASERARAQAEQAAAEREAARMARLITDRAEMEARPIGTTTNKPTNPDPLDGLPYWFGPSQCDRCYARPGLWEWNGTEWLQAPVIDGHLAPVWLGGSGRLPWATGPKWEKVEKPRPGEAHIRVANPGEACQCGCHYMAYA
jgi:hypothetical protein